MTGQRRPSPRPPWRMLAAVVAAALVGIGTWFGYVVVAREKPMRVGVLASGADRPLVHALRGEHGLELVVLERDLRGAVRDGDIDAALLNAVRLVGADGFGMPTCGTGECLPIVVVPGNDTAIEERIVDAVGTAAVSIGQLEIATDVHVERVSTPPG